MDYVAKARLDMKTKDVKTTCILHNVYISSELTTYFDGVIYVCPKTCTHTLRCALSFLQTYRRTHLTLKMPSPINM